MSRLPAFLATGERVVPAAITDWKLEKTFGPQNPLPVVMRAQQLSRWCWATVTSAIDFYYQNPNPRQPCQVATDSLLFQCCPPDLDTEANPKNRPYALRTALRHNLAGDFDPKPAPFNIAVAQINAQRPICCGFPGVGGIGHFAIVIGYVPGTNDLLIADSLFGPSQLPWNAITASYQNVGGWTETYFTQAFVP